MTYDLFTRTTTRNHYAVTQEIFLGLLENGYIFPQDHARRDLAVDRPHAARPLHRGHLPDLRVPAARAATSATTAATSSTRPT